MIGLNSIPVSALSVDHRRAAYNAGLLIVVAVVALFLAIAPDRLLLLAVGATTAAVVLLRWPWLIWPGLAAMIPVSSGIRYGRVSLTEALILVATGLWFVDGVRRKTLQTYLSSVLLPLLAFIAVMGFSMLRAPDLGDGFVEVVKWVEFALILMLMPVMIDRQRAVWVAAGLLLGGVVQAALGMVQFAFQIGPEWFILFGRFMRASGSFRQPNPYAAYLGVLLPIAVSLALWIVLQWNKTNMHRIQYVAWTTYFAGTTAAIGAGILVSWSRGAWLATAVALVASIAFRSLRSFFATLAGLILLSVLTIFGLFAPSIVPPALMARMSGSLSFFADGSQLSTVVNQSVNDDNFAAIERFAHWIAGIRMWESAPWLGIGVGNYATVYEQYRLPLWTEALGHAHNLYINLLAEVGLIGLGAFALFWVWTAVWALRRRSCSCADPANQWCTAMSAGVIGSIAYLSVHSLVDMLFVQGIYLVLAVSLAILASGSRGTSRHTGESTEGLGV